MGTMMVTEKARLRECEAIVEKDSAAFMRVGVALAEIRDSKLYRDTHKTFELYCQERWKFTKSRANQLIQAAGVAKNLTSITCQKPNAIQAEALAKAPPEKQEAVWEKVASNGKPTAAKVAAAVAELDDDWGDEEEAEEVEPSTEEAMAAWNKKVESFARSITAIAKDAPKGGWWDESQANIVAQNLKAAAGSARQAKCEKVCPKCEGDGCKWCKSTGFMPEQSYILAGGK
jgi:hypothetical protein